MSDKYNIPPKTIIPVVLSCKKCGHSWIRRTPNPLRCPRCNSFHWLTGIGNRKSTRDKTRYETRDKTIRFSDETEESKAQ